MKELKVATSMKPIRNISKPYTHVDDKIEDNRKALQDAIHRGSTIDLWTIWNRSISDAFTKRYNLIGAKKRHSSLHGMTMIKQDEVALSKTYKGGTVDTTTLTNCPWKQEDSNDKPTGFTP